MCALLCFICCLVANKVQRLGLLCHQPMGSVEAEYFRPSRSVLTRVFHEPTTFTYDLLISETDHLLVGKV